MINQQSSDLKRASSLLTRLSSVQKALEDVSNGLKTGANCSPGIISQLEEVAKHSIEKKKYQDSLYCFFEAAWPQISAKPFIHGWHLEAICTHLEALFRREIRDLIVNIPIRCGKSVLACVVFPAWVWSNNPSETFIYASHSHNFAERDSVACRHLILSPWYQKYWGDTVILRQDMNSKRKFGNTMHGYRLIKGVGTPITGEGADFLFIDDANDMSKVQSKAYRNSVNNWNDSAMTSRVSNPATACKCNLQQRGHFNDLTGHLLSKEDQNWVHLSLPMRFNSQKICVTKTNTNLVWVDPRAEEGELLWPEMWNHQAVRKMESSMGSYNAAGQLQQEPSPAQGGIFKEDWFQWYKHKDPPLCEYVVQSWDTAFGENNSGTKSIGSYSACTTWGVFKDQYGAHNVILLSLYQGRIEYPELRQMAQRLSKNYHDTIYDSPLDIGPQPDYVLVEAKANGLSLLQDLRRLGINAVKFNPLQDKVTRGRSVAHIIESGNVWLPALPPNYQRLRPYSEKFLQAAISFPNLESNDVIDSMSQALKRLIDGGWINHPDDFYEDQGPQSLRNKLKKFY